jgi:hypothetical protein
MTAVWILSVIFIFIIITSILDQRHSLRKRKIEAALRIREMELGLPPGTYSAYNHKWKKHFKQEDWEKVVKNFKPSSGPNRADLKQGIDDLQQRLANLETIIESQAGEENKE